MFIAILDDDELRRDHMRALLADVAPHATVHFFDNAPDIIHWLERPSSPLALVSLDHDLGPNRTRDGVVFDPGTGRDVVEHLLRVCNPVPLIVHTSNGPAATGMVTALELGGWSPNRVVPRADIAWLQDAWLPCVKQLLLQRAL